MRVAYISMDPGIPVFGPKGASNHLREFSSALVDYGCNVTVFAAKAGKTASQVPFRIEHLTHRKRFQSGASPALEELHALEQNCRLEDVLLRSHDKNPFDLVYERYSLWSHAGQRFASASGLPYVLEVNSPLNAEQKAYRELHLEDTATLIEELLFRSADLVVAVSAEVAAYVCTVSRRQDRVLVVPNGVELDRFANLSHGSERASFDIGFLGSLKPWHGIDILLDSFRLLAMSDPSCRLLIVGHGPNWDQIEQFARKYLLVDRIELVGAVEKDRVPELLGRMDVAVAPYPNLENFYFSPLKIFEYMAAGRPIVASRIGQVCHILCHGSTALLSQPGNVQDLAGQIRILRHDSNLARQLGAAARFEAFQHHGWERRVQAILHSVSVSCATTPHVSPAMNLPREPSHAC